MVEITNQMKLASPRTNEMILANGKNSFFFDRVTNRMTVTNEMTNQVTVTNQMKLANQVMNQVMNQMTNQMTGQMKIMVRTMVFSVKHLVLLRIYVLPTH